MKNRIKYTNEPVSELSAVRDFLPSPDELAFKEEKVKVTISLSRGSLDFLCPNGYPFAGRVDGAVRTGHLAA